MTWRERALALIDEVHREIGRDCTIEQLKAELRKHAHDYHGGTSWGQKMWSSARQQYFKAKFGIQPAVKQRTVEDSPLFNASDIAFPFRENRNG